MDDDKALPCGPSSDQRMTNVQRVLSKLSLKPSSQLKKAGQLTPLPVTDDMSAGRRNAAGQPPAALSRLPSLASPGRTSGTAGGVWSLVPVSLATESKNDVALDDESFHGGRRHRAVAPKLSFAPEGKAERRPRGRSVNMDATAAGTGFNIDVHRARALSLFARTSLQEQVEQSNSASDAASIPAQDVADLQQRMNDGSNWLDRQLMRQALCKQPQFSTTATTQVHSKSAADVSSLCKLENAGSNSDSNNDNDGHCVDNVLNKLHNLLSENDDNDGLTLPGRMESFSSKVRIDSPQTWREASRFCSRLHRLLLCGGLAELFPVRRAEDA
eukprot:363882-Chlamydomonas_euryale.AAC.5